MRLHSVIVRELLHYRWNSVAGLAAVMLAVGAIAGTAMLLGAYETDAAGALRANEARLQEQLADMRADVDRAMGELGFNLTILPQGQEVADWYAQDETAPTMPETAVGKLREAGIAAVRNPVGQLRRRVTWPEEERWKGWPVVVLGRGAIEPGSETGAAERGSNSRPAEVSGEPAPLAERYLKPPPPGSVALGHEIHQTLGLRQGDEIRFHGRTLRVERCLLEEGNRDDITIVMTLREAQELLDQPGHISEIVAQGTSWALENIELLRQQVAQVLPGSQVVQRVPDALAARLAAMHAGRIERQRLEQERAAQAELNRDRRRLAGLINLLVVASCGLWVGWLAWSNVAERRAEIGIWRACGLRARRLAAIFLGRWVVLGAAGTAAGLTAAAALTPGAVGGSAALEPGLLAIAVVVALVLSALAASVAALAAAREDPATALRAG